MASRVLVNFVAAAALLATTTASFAIGEAEEMTRGGRPFSFFDIFGISSGSRQTVNYGGNYAPGTIVINTPERHLYLMLGGGQALRYGIGVGRIGFTWSGVKTVSAKKEWPGWTPPSQMLRRRPDLPRYMPGGIDNPLGARAIYLGSSLYRIHGSNEPETIGQAVSSGCFRMTNEDVTDLYDRVRVGAKVIVQQ
jgi:lipoprotein-anchoring transpeptidase ErfK/SrfK